jgi:transglutaminase-like putative cysteine protease
MSSKTNQLRSIVILIKGTNSMTSPHKVAFVLVVIAVVLAGSLAVAFFLTHPSSNKVISAEEFEEFDEMSINIDASGNANCQLVIQMPPSKFADLLKQLTPLVGTVESEQSYVESLLSSNARCGLEVRDPSCEISIGENFTIILRWKTPAFARWDDNRWVITSEWIDNLSAANETIAEDQDSWVFVRNVAEMYNIQDARYRISFSTVLTLPENTENIQCPLIDSSKTIDYGGGAYSADSLHFENIDAKPTIVENGLALFVAENSITITPDKLVENSLFYTINYTGVAPENVSFVSSLEKVRLDLKYGRELRDQYSIYDGGQWISLSPAQVLYYAADAIDNYNKGGQFSIQQPISVIAPDNENGDWEACWENLSKDDYTGLAENIRSEIGTTGRAPGTFQTPIGKIRFRDILFTFTRILSYYAENGELPSMITFAPAPTGVLIRENREIPANYAYFLLPDAYVVTDTDNVKKVLDSVYKVGNDNMTFAKNLCNWTATNIAYRLSYNPPTSEETLSSRKGQCRDYANLYLALTRTAGMPARRVEGWVVSSWQPPAGWEFVVGTTPDGKPIGGHAWTEVYLPGEGWVPADPTANSFENLRYEVYKQMEETWTEALAGYETSRGLI